MSSIRTFLKCAYSVKERVIPNVTIGKHIPGWRIIHNRLRRAGVKESVTLFGKYPDFWLDPYDCNGLSFEDIPKHHEGIVNYFRKNVCPGDLCIDVGAHIGFFTVLFADLAGPINVVAFEPDPHNYYHLFHNAPVGVRCINKAVSNSEGLHHFYCNPNVSGDHSLIPSNDRYGATLVESFQLDSLSQTARVRRATWVKIDVQGAEHDVILSMRNLIALGATVVMEWWPYGLELAGTQQEWFLSQLAGMFKKFGKITSQGVLLTDSPAEAVAHLNGRGKDAHCDIVMTNR